MVWAGISWASKTPLIVVNGNLNSEEYVKLLEEHFLPFRDKYYARSVVFQQDNARAHNTAHTREFLMEKELTEMPWPARLPDMNCIKNAWGQLSRRLYEGGRQFDAVDDLREALFFEWNKLEIPYIKSLVSSMPDRVAELRRNIGLYTHY